jgi:hypothetical protein
MPPFRKIIYVNASVMNVTCRKEKTRVDSHCLGVKVGFRETQENRKHHAAVCVTFVDQVVCPN